MNRMTIILVGIAFTFSIAFAVLVKMYVSLREENNRIASNFEQVTSENKHLNLTVDEYKQIHDKDKNKLDSVIKANDIKLKSLKSATIINLEYKDTTPPEILYLKPEIEPISEIYSIPFTSKNECWGVEGFIKSKDPKSTINIVERTANNSAQLLVTRKQFLGFLWYLRKGETYQGFSDCGKLNFTQIDFAKK